MAFPGKELRKISVNGKMYHWIASGNDGQIDVFIESAEVKGQRLYAQLSYHSVYGNVDENGGRPVIQRMQVTPSVIRQIIEYGLANGWKPFEKAKELNLRSVDQFIDYKLRNQ